MTHRKKLIEVALPLDDMNAASGHEKYIRKGHPSTMHLWWARRPLATCRAVVFAQLVDDPSAWPEQFPTEEDQERERERLFDIIRELVPWKATGERNILVKARREIAQSAARAAIADGDDDPRHHRVLDDASDDEISAYLARELPPVVDPFAGGGSIPLEAQRLGLRTVASDLNPVAVLLNKIQVELGPRFAGQPPVFPGAAKALQTWRGAAGLADDLRRYAQWLKQQAEQRVGHLYPDVELEDGSKATVIAWLWARTVPSPDPAAGGTHVPLLASYWICKRKKKKKGKTIEKLAWVEPIVDRDSGAWRFEVRTGEPEDRDFVSAGTKAGRGTFRCLLSGAPISSDYLHTQGKAGNIRHYLTAIVADGDNGRIYCTPTEAHRRAADVEAESRPQAKLGTSSRHLTPVIYGYETFGSLYTERQLKTLNTFTSLIPAAREKALEDALAAGMEGDATLADGGSGARAYSDAMAVLLALSVSRRHDRWSAFSIWHTSGEKLESLIRLSAVPMTWEFAEGNPFSTSTGNYLGGVKYTADAVEALGVGPEGRASQADARAPTGDTTIFSTDPPYFDNVPYADLSDLFYVWLRRMVRPILPGLMSTMLVPKAAEIVADPARHENKEEAEEYFLNGMQEVLARIHKETVGDVPVTIFYAFKQRQTKGDGVVSTGWETFLSALIDAGFVITGTWPVRTEQSGGLRAVGRNALATSVVLVCRRRPDDAQVITRSDFRRLLRRELPAALQHLQHGNIAPVDMAQAAIGPGIAVFSRHAQVLEADGSPMDVRTALQIINQAMDDYLTESEGELDPETRFAVTWFGTHGFDKGPFGDAETLAKARNVSVAGVAEAGLLVSGGNKVRLHTREELPERWDPRTDRHLTVWEATQHLIKRLDDEGEQAAADLMTRLSAVEGGGSVVEAARLLAYRLFDVCEQKSWAEEAGAYNRLVAAWPELARLSGKRTPGGSADTQEELL